MLRLAHGEVRTPAFVPLATKASVKALEAARGRRARLRHGARQHVPPVPRPRPRADPPARRAAPLHALGAADHHRLRRLPGLLDGPRHGRRRDQGPPGPRRAHGRDPRRSTRRACASAPTSTAPSSSWAPRPRWRSRPRCGSDIALVFDECTPFNVTRDYTARSTERTHRWLERCLDWHAEHGPERPARLRDRPGRRLRGPAARVGPGGRGPRAGRDRDRRLARARTSRRCTRSSAGRSSELPEDAPRHLLGIGEIDDLLRGVELGIDTFDCAMPTRLGRHGVAIVPDPAQRWRVDLAKGRFREADEPILEGCPCPACARGYSRAYLRYLLKRRELTALAAADDPQPRLRAALMAACASDRAGRLAEARRRCARRGAVGARRKGAVSGKRSTAPVSVRRGPARPTQPPLTFAAPPRASASVVLDQALDLVDRVLRRCPRRSRAAGPRRSAPSWAAW